MDPRSLSPSDEAVIWAATDILAKRGISFEEAQHEISAGFDTNQVETALPAVSRDPTDTNFEFPTLARSYQDCREPTDLNSVHETHAGYIPSADSSFAFEDGVINLEDEIFGQPEEFLPHMRFAGPPASRAHLPSPSSSSLLSLTGNGQTSLDSQSHRLLPGVVSSYEQLGYLPNLYSAPFPEGAGLNTFNTESNDTFMWEGARDVTYRPQPSPIRRRSQISPQFTRHTDASPIGPHPPRSSGQPFTIQEDKNEVQIDVSQSATSSLSKRKRPSFSDSTENERRQLLREVGACLTCAIQKYKCDYDPKTPLRGCSRCQRLQAKHSGLSDLECIRAKLLDTVLFRELVDPVSKRPNFSLDFDNGILKPVTWGSSEKRTIELTQDFGSVLTLKVRSFDSATLDSTTASESQRLLYQCQWALADLLSSEDEMDDFIVRSLPQAVKNKVDVEDTLALPIFHEACKIACQDLQGESSHLLSLVLKLWTATRCIEGGWRFHGLESLGLQPTTSGMVPLTDAAIIDNQVSSLFAVRFLRNLRLKVLNQFHHMATSGKSEKRKHWFALFLASFILLHNYECIMKHQKKWALENGYGPQDHCTPPMTGLVKGVLFGSKVILTLFHYLLKGRYPFEESWKPGKGAQFSELNDSQIDFVKFVAGQIKTRGTEFSKLQQTEKFEAHGWFTGQLFLRDWRPPRTAYD